MFPTLHSTYSTGKSMMWSIQVTERDGCGVIETTRGFTDGKKQINEKVISEGKNIGKKNETSVEEQTVLVCDKTWKDKKEKDEEAQLRREKNS